MCKHKILAHNENGYIAICGNCDHYQVAFGTAVMSLPAERYTAFAEYVYEQSGLQVYSDFPTQKTVILPVFCGHLQMILSFNELLKLEELLKQAGIISEVNKIIYPENWNEHFPVNDTEETD